MTQKEFSESLGITQRAVINYEISGRVPKKKILAAICEQFKICEHWLLTGEGPMHAGEGTNEMADTSAISPPFLYAQPIENIGSQAHKMADMSAISPLYEENRNLYQKNMELQERLLSLTEQNAELRLQLERRDLRIRELEKENAGLREARGLPLCIVRLRGKLVRVFGVGYNADFNVER